MNFCVIYNPVAPHFSQDILDYLIKRMTGKGHVLTQVLKSEYSGHVIKLIKEQDPVSDLIVTTIRISNVKDYPEDLMEELAGTETPANPFRGKPASLFHQAFLFSLPLRGRTATPRSGCSP